MKNSCVIVKLTSMSRVEGNDSRIHILYIHLFQTNHLNITMKICIQKIFSSSYNFCIEGKIPCYASWFERRKFSVFQFYIMLVCKQTLRLLRAIFNMLSASLITYLLLRRKFYSHFHFSLWRKPHHLDALIKFMI